MVYTEHLLSFRILEFHYMPPVRSCLYGQPPIKTLAPKSLMRVPCRQYLKCVVTTPCWVVKPILCDSTETGLGNPCLVSPRLSPEGFFPFADSPSYPFAVINYSCEFINYMLNPLSPRLPKNYQS